MNNKSKLIRLILAIVVILIWTWFASENMFAAPKADYNDPEYLKRLEHQQMAQEEENLPAITNAKNSTTDPYTNKTYSHEESKSGMECHLGIDVSKWQEDINWDKAVESGVEFVFLRIGYSATKTGEHYADPYYQTNYQATEERKIPNGIYFFSQAITPEEAKSEAKYTLKLMGDSKLELPIVYDIESPSGSRVKEASLTRDEVTAICEAYCSVIREAGYETMVYGSYYDLRDWFRADVLSEQNDIWIARYNTSTGYSGKYSFWQYTESGKVPGIYGGVDCNFYYGKLDALTSMRPGAGEDDKDDMDLDANQAGKPGIPAAFKAKAEDSAIALSWNPEETALGTVSYEIYRSLSLGGTYELVDVSKENYYLDKNAEEGINYYYKVKAKVTKEDGSVVAGDLSGAEDAFIPYSNPWKIKIETNCNVRSEAGTEYGVVGGLNEGDKVTVVSCTRSKSGVRWYHVSGSVDGYVSSNCAIPFVAKMSAPTRAAFGSKYITIQWKEAAGADGYEIARADAKNGSYKVVKSVGASTLKWKNTGLIKYCQYYYKVRAHMTVDGKTYYSKWSSVALIGGKTTVVNMKTREAVNIRKYAGTAFKSYGKLPAGQRIKATARTRDKEGRWWYYVTTTYNGKTINGYILLDYLKKI